MLDYILGKVVKKDSQSIVLDLRGIGFKIYCSNTSFYKINDEYKIYTYSYVREGINDLYGFKSEKEKELFLRLISINGIGPKTSNCILAIGSVDEIISAINNEDIVFLKKASNVNTKIAQQIILELRGKLQSYVDADFVENSELEDARNALLALSFKGKEIDPILYNAKTTCKTSKEYFSYVCKTLGKSKGI